MSNERFNFPPPPPGLPGDWGNHHEPFPKGGTVRWAGLPRRLGAILIDWIAPQFVQFQHQQLSGLVFLLIVANSVVLQGLTGQSLGKYMFDITLAYVPTPKHHVEWEFCRPGVIRCAVRFALHLFDVMIAAGGVFKLLIDPRTRSWADVPCQTYIVRSNDITLR